MAIMALAVMPALAGGPVQAQPGIGERLFAYVAACRTAILTGEIAAFADLEVETEAVTDAMEIRGWRGRQEQGLVVSLMRRAVGHGVCDVSYRPVDMNAELMTELAAIRSRWEEAEADNGLAVENSPSGPVYMACADGRGLALFFDPAARGAGFAAQMASVPSSRLKCDG